MSQRLTWQADGLAGLIDHHSLDQLSKEILVADVENNVLSKFVECFLNFWFRSPNMYLGLA